MKVLVFVVLCAIAGVVASNPMLASMDYAMELAMFTHKIYVNATCRKSSTINVKLNIKLCIVYCFQHLLLIVAIRVLWAAVLTL